MPPVKKVAILGATGPLGRALVPALLSAGFEVTCITRSSSTNPAPAGIDGATAAVVSVSSYSDVPALTSALRGHDALVEAFNPAASAHQEAIVAAALGAGSVAHVVTPDFSGDTFNAAIGEVRIFDPKLRAQRALEAAVEAAQGRLAWTAIVTGPWFDWAAETGIFWVDGRKKRVTRYGSGDQRVSLSRLALTGEALVKVLSEPEKFRNRPAYFASHTVSTNELIRVVKDINGFEGWEVVDVDVAGYLAEGRRLWDEDTKNGVENRLASKAYPMLGIASMMTEDNRYGADYSAQLEPGSDEGEEALKEGVKKILDLA